MLECEESNVRTAKSMPAQSKRAKAAKAKRQTGADTFKASVKPASPETESESDWRLTDSEGHTDETEDEDAYGIMQLRFAKYFKKPLHKKDLVREPAVSFIFCKRESMLIKIVQKKRRKDADRPPIYTGDSRSTAWRSKVKAKERAQGCMKLDSFMFTSVPVCASDPV